MKYSKNGYKRNSKDKNNPYNIIPSGDITMEGVDFPVYGIDNLGNEQIMMPGANYIFPGNTVFEVPLAQNGIEIIESDDQGYDINEMYPKIIENTERFDISGHKQKLLEKLNSPTFRERYKKNWFNLTGEDLTDEELDARLNEQIEYAKAGPDFSLVPPYVEYDQEGNYLGRYGQTEDPFYITERNKRAFDDRHTGHIGKKFARDVSDAEHSYLDRSWVGPRPSQNPEDYNWPDIYEKYPWAIGHARDIYGNIAEPDRITTHELAHIYNSTDSPLFRHMIKSSTDKDRKDYQSIVGGNYGMFQPKGRYREWIENLFGKDYFEKENYHALMSAEISSAKAEIEEVLKRNNVWDFNKEKFSSKHLNNLLNADQMDTVYSDLVGGESRMHLRRMGYNDLKRSHAHLTGYKGDFDFANELLAPSKNRNYDTLLGYTINDILGNEVQNIFNLSQQDVKEKNRYSSIESALEDLNSGKKRKEKKAQIFLDNYWNNASDAVQRIGNIEIEKRQNILNQKKEEVQPKLEMYFNEIVQNEDNDQLQMAQDGGEESNMHPFEQWAVSQEMDPQQALQMVLSNPDNYPSEVIQAAQAYYEELKQLNTINDKQDEKLYNAEEYEQQIPEFQGDEGSSEVNEQDVTTQENKESPDYTGTTQGEGDEEEVQEWNPPPIASPPSTYNPLNDADYKENYLNALKRWNQNAPDDYYDPRVVIHNTPGRAHYEPYYETINLYLGDGDDVLSHELHHHLQNIDNELTYHQMTKKYFPDNAGLHFETYVPKPKGPVTHQVLGNYYDRRGLEKGMLMNKFMDANPDYRFFPAAQEVAYDRMEDDQYDVPWTMEGEAYEIEKQGGYPINILNRLRKNATTYNNGGPFPKVSNARVDNTEVRYPMAYNDYGFLPGVYTNYPYQYRVPDHIRNELPNWTDDDDLRSAHEAAFIALEGMDEKIAADKNMRNPKTDGTRHRSIGEQIVSPIWKLLKTGVRAAPYGLLLNQFDQIINSEKYDEKIRSGEYKESILSPFFWCINYGINCPPGYEHPRYGSSTQAIEKGGELPKAQFGIPQFFRWLGTLGKKAPQVVDNITPNPNTLDPSEYHLPIDPFSDDALGLYNNPLATRTLDDFTTRVKTDEGRNRLISLMNEEIIGSHGLWDEIPLDIPGKVNPYTNLINTTLDEWYAGLDDLRIINKPGEFGQFNFNAAKQPRIYMNPKIPYLSSSIGPTTSHELGHYTQSLISRFLADNIGKIHPKNVIGNRWDVYNRIKYPGNTDIDRVLGKNFEIRSDVTFPGTGSISDNAMDLTGDQIESVLSNIGRDQGTTDAFNYFARALETGPDGKKIISKTNPLGSSREGLTSAAELRRSMFETGFIDDMYQTLSGEDIANYYKNYVNASGVTAGRSYHPRLLEFGNLSMDNLNLLASQINRIPAAIPFVAGAGALGYSEKAGPGYQVGGEELDYTPQTQQQVKLKNVKDGEVNLIPYVQHNIPYDIEFHETEVPNYIKLRQSIAESTLNPKAVSRVGAKGLTQVMPKTLKDYKEKTGDTNIDLFNYEDAMKVQNWYINDLYNASFIANKPNQSDMVRMAKALVAYNWGRTNLYDHLTAQKKAGVNIYDDNMAWLYHEEIPEETRNYLRKILWDNHPQMTKDYNIIMNDKDKYKTYLDAYDFEYKKGGENKKLKALWKQYKKWKKGENLSSVVLDELKDKKIINSNKVKPETQKKFMKVDAKNLNVSFADSYDLEKLIVKKVSRGGETSLTLNQQINFYNDYINSVYDNTPQFNKATDLYDKINRLYVLDAKKKGGSIFDYMKSLPKFQGDEGSSETGYDSYNVPTEEQVTNELLFPNVESSTEENPIMYDGRNLGAIIYYTPSKGSDFFTSDSERMIPYLDETYGAGNWKAVELPQNAYKQEYLDLLEQRENHPGTIARKKFMHDLDLEYGPKIDELENKRNNLDSSDMTEEEIDNEIRRLYKEWDTRGGNYGKEWHKNLQQNYPDLYDLNLKMEEEYPNFNYRSLSGADITNKYFTDLKNLRSDGKIFIMQHSDTRVGPLMMTETHRNPSSRTPEITDTFAEILLPESAGGWLADNNQVICYGGMCSGVRQFKDLTEESGVTTVAQPGTWSGYQPIFGDALTEQFFNTDEYGIIDPRFQGGAYVTHALNDGVFASDTTGYFPIGKGHGDIVASGEAITREEFEAQQNMDPVPTEPIDVEPEYQTQRFRRDLGPRRTRTLEPYVGGERSYKYGGQLSKAQFGGWLRKLFTKSADDLTLTAKQAGKNLDSSINLVNPVNPAGSDIFGSPYMFEEPMNMPFNYTENPANNALNAIGEMFEPLRIAKEEARIIKENNEKLNPLLNTLFNATGRATTKVPIKGANVTKEYLFKLAEDAKLFEPRRINWKQAQIDKYWYFDQASGEMKIRKTGYSRTTSPGRKDYDISSNRPGENQTFPDWLRKIDADYQAGLARGEYQDVIGYDIDAIDRFAWSLKHLGHDITGAEFKKMFPQKIYHGSPNTFDQPIIDWSNPDMRPPGMSLDEFYRLKEARGFKDNPPTFFGTLDPTYSVGYSASGKNNWKGGKTLAHLAKQENYNLTPRTGVLADDVSSLSGHQTYTYTIPDNANIRYTTGTLTGHTYRNADGSLTREGQKLVDEGVDVIWGRNSMGGSELLHLTANSVENFSAVPKLDRSKLHQPGYFQDADIADMPQLQYELETGIGKRGEYPWNLFGQRHIEHPNLMGGPAITVPYQSPYGGSPSLDITKMNPEDFLMRGDQHFMKGILEEGPGIEYYTPYTTPYFDEGGEDLPRRQVGGVISALRNIFKKAPKFASEIDWAKWNKAIPEDKVLMEEYHAIEEMTKRNGTWMKNPDGSNFVGSPEQFVQQQSDNFKAAFGESKLLNPDGSPMIVYHGSAKKFDQFDPKRFMEGDAGYSGVGIYTTPSKTSASTYAYSSRTDTDKFIPTIYELYGNTINPLFSSRLIDNVGGDIYPFGMTLTDAHKIDKSLPLDLFNFKRPSNQFGDDIRLYDPFDAAVHNQQRGITHKRSLGDAYEIVFPNITQVKSSIGNVGTFDLTNPNIYKQYGGDYGIHY